MKTKKVAVFVDGGELVLGNYSEAEPVGFVQSVVWIVLTAVNDFGTAGQTASAVAFAVQIMSILRVSPTKGSFQQKIRSTNKTKNE